MDNFLEKVKEESFWQEINGRNNNNKNLKRSKVCITITIQLMDLSAHDLDLIWIAEETFLLHRVPADNQHPLSVISTLAETKGRLFSVQVF